MDHEPHREVWHCPHPPDSRTYRVLREWWDEDYTVRHIYEAESTELTFTTQTKELL